MTRTLRKERGDVEFYLKNKLLRQVKIMKYLGTILDKTYIQRKYNRGDRRM